MYKIWLDVTYYQDTENAEIKMWFLSIISDSIKASHFQSKLM